MIKEEDRGPTYTVRLKYSTEALDCREEYHYYEEPSPTDGWVMLYGVGWDEETGQRIDYMVPRERISEIRVKV